MKKILVIQGGGRAKGNTAQLIRHFVKGAEESGHLVEVISLIKNEVKGCLGCNACRYGKPCVQKDAFNDIVPKIKEADCIVFASPLYFWTVSSRIKAFIERFYCIAEEDLNPPLGRYERYPVKDCALLMTSADDFFWTFEQAVSYYQFTMVNYIGFKDRGMVLAGGCGDTNGKPQIDKTIHLQAAYEFGKNLYFDSENLKWGTWLYEIFDVNPIFRESYTIGKGHISFKGYQITEACIGCGNCVKNCPQMRNCKPGLVCSRQKECTKPFFVHS